MQRVPETGGSGNPNLMNRERCRVGPVKTDKDPLLPTKHLNPPAKDV